MEFIKAYRKAGEPTAVAPLYLCEQARKTLSIWKDQPLHVIHERVNRQIQEIDRYEFIAIEEGIIKGMMVICIEPEEIHTGEDVLYTKLAFSTVPGALKEGYKAMKCLSKELNIPLIHLSRHPDRLRRIRGNSIIN